MDTPRILLFGKNGQVGWELRRTLAPTAQVTAVDFLTIDIELWEPKALAGFDVERFKPALVCIEAHPQVRQQILDYFALHSYTVVGRYLRADAQNLYFMPHSGL